MTPTFTEICDLISQTNKGLPLVLLPVRLETRFEDLGRDQWRLKIRIYPDDIHVDSHEPELDSVEEEWGQHFWVQYWSALSVTEDEAVAWSQLVKRFGGPRAAWIANVLTPLNPGDKPSELTPQGELPVQPQFPKVGQRASRWTRAAVARLLPDRWMAWGRRDGTLLVNQESAPVQRDLAIGPDPSTFGGSQDPVPVDAGMKWMVDFAEAAAVGMGMTATFSGEPRIDRLVVCGLRSDQPDVQAGALADHLVAIRHSTGLDFAPQGIATNSTDAARSGWSTGEDDETSAEAMARWIGTPGVGDPLDNASVLSRALYVDRDVFGRARHGADNEQLHARLMNQMLWPVTGAYFLRSMVGAAMGVTSQIMEDVRQHWIEHVRARGPLPTLRVGNQPYGVLPVIVGQVVDPRATHVEDFIETMVREARRSWNGSAPDVTSLHLDSESADEDLVQALATLPHLQRVYVRLAVGRSVIQDLATALGGTWTGPQFDFVETRSWLSDVAGFDTTGAPIHNLLFSLGAREWVTPMVADQLSDFEPLTDNYLQWIGTSSVGAIAAENHSLPNDSLLYVLARRAALLWDDPTIRVGAPTGDVRNAANQLSTAPSAVLDLAFREVLGQAAYRLDAWETSLATRRLAEERDRLDASPTETGGVFLGCFGWVENLVAKDAVQHASSPSLGFIHAPSREHGVTATLLRSAWYSHGAGPDTPFATDLTSSRARAGLALLDGVRNGFTLGELLGYWFERQLHEGHDVSLDQHISLFRELAPLVVDKQPGTESGGATPASQLGAAAVVDGLRLLALWRAQDQVLSDALFNMSPTDRDKVETSLDGLAESVDALSDLSLAEGIHHLAQGNLERSAAMIDAVTTGSLPPPELDVISPPRSGIGVVHRVVVPLDDTAGGSSWPGGLTEPRALADPQLERWVASLLPDPTEVVTKLTWDSGSEMTVSLGDLGLCALDAVALASTEGGLSGELETRLRWRSERKGPVGVAGPYDDVDLEFAGPLGSVSFADFAVLSTSVRDLLTSARPLHAADLASPTDAVEPGFDVAELLARSDQWAASLRSTHAALLAVDPEGDLDLVRSALIDAARIGIPGAFPRSAAGSDPEDVATLTAQLASVATRVGQVVAEVGDDGDIAAAVQSSSVTAAIKLLTRRLQAIFGKTLPVLPRFTVADPVEVEAAFANSGSLQGGNPHASAGWLHRVAKVRTGPALLAESITLAEALGDSTLLRLSVAQLPQVPGERWAALPFGATVPDGGRISIVALDTGAIQWDGAIAGLLIDQWSEVIPRPRQTTSAAFHYDAPASRAPQAVLMLGLLEVVDTWTPDAIRDGLFEAFAGCTRRLTDVSALENGGHFVPAIFLETNAPDEAVADDVERGLVDPATAVGTPTPLTTPPLPSGGTGGP